MPPRFYLLHGPDEFGMAEFVAALKAKMGDPSLAALNTTLFDGRSVTLAELRSACDAVPFLAPRRLVLVEGWLTRLLGKSEAEDGDGAAPSASSRETLAALAEYLPALPDTTALVFVEKREIPGRNPVLKAATGGDWGYVKLFDMPRGEALVSWILARARSEGGELTREAAHALASVEADPRALGNEIRKLLTYVDYARAVEAADVENLTPAGGEARIFDLVDAIGQRRGQPATRQLHRLLEKEDPLYVLGMIVRQFRLILLAKEMLAARADEAEIAKTLGVHPYAAGKVCAQARNFSLSDLEHIYRRLLDYDVDIKTGRMAAATALDTLVVSLTGA
jgi:DNA polymerase-3 subunit delta